MLKITHILSALFVLGCVNGLPSTQSKSLSRWKWEIWEDLPDENFLRVYLFNITNPDEFENGDEPILHEIGPYVFRERRDKVSITHINATASFKELLTYEYIANESVGSDSDVINWINIPFLSFGKKLAEVPVYGPIHFKTLVKSKEKLVRRSEKIADLMYYGVNAKPYLDVLELLNPGEIPPQFSEGRFGLFKGRNGTDEGELLVETGETPESSYGKILQWKGKTVLDNWDGEYCNMINGTDGSVFDPNNMEKYDVRVFFPDACRSLDYTYAGEQMFEGILGLKYTFSKEMLEDPRKNPNNKCFCVNPGEDMENCLKKGIMDISPCREGAPIALSYPHFLDADKSYAKKVNGLNPNVDKHESYMIVEPKTGTVLVDKKRFQLNMNMKPIPDLTALKKLKEMLFPVMWSERSHTLDAASIAALKEELKKHENDGPSWHSNVKPTDNAAAAEAKEESEASASTPQIYSAPILMTILVITKLFIL